MFASSVICAWKKIPLRAAFAVRNVPSDSKLRVTHLGKAHDEMWTQKARDEMKRNPRYTWNGEVSYATVRREYQKTQVMVMSSVMEGGAQCYFRSRRRRRTDHRIEHSRQHRSCRRRSH